MKSSKLMWLIWFIASFAAFHYGLMAFDINLLALPFVTKIKLLPKIIMIIFGFCGLISIITLLGSCESECK